MLDQPPYSYRVVKLNLNAGLSDLEFEIQGERVTYLSPVDGPVVEIRLASVNADKIPLRPQGEIIAPFLRLFVTAPVSGVIVYLLISSPASISVTGRDQTVSSDRWFNDLRNGRCFAGYGPSSPTVGEYSHAQLYNPVGSGVNLLVRSCRFQPTGGSSNARLSRYDTAMATLCSTVKNLLASGGAPRGEIRTSTNIAEIGSSFMTFAAPATAPQEFLDTWTHEIPPGKGLSINVTQTGIGVIGNFIWSEIEQ